MVHGLLLSGGRGSRLGTEIPKQYLKIKEADQREIPIITYSLCAIAACPQIDTLTLVAEEEWQDFLLGELEHSACKDKFLGFAQPGETRQLSIYHGMKKIQEYLGKREEADYILIHDAARPNITRQDFTSLIQGAEGRDGALPVLPMKDTVYQLREDKSQVQSLLNRNLMGAGQAPEIFRMQAYQKANEALMYFEEGCLRKDSPIYQVTGSTEPAILSGMKIVALPGNENNFKITTKRDLEYFQYLRSL